MSFSGFCGKSSLPAKIVLIATHADLCHCPKNATGEYINVQAECLLYEVIHRFQYVFDIHDKVFVVNAHGPNNPSMKSFKNFLVETKAKLVQVRSLSGIFRLWFMDLRRLKMSSYFFVLFFIFLVFISFIPVFTQIDGFVGLHGVSSTSLVQVFPVISSVVLASVC